MHLSILGCSPHHEVCAFTFNFSEISSRSRERDLYDTAGRGPSCQSVQNKGHLRLRPETVSFGQFWTIPSILSFRTAPWLSIDTSNMAISQIWNVLWLLQKVTLAFPKHHCRTMNERSVLRSSDYQWNQKSCDTSF